MTTNTQLALFSAEGMLRAGVRFRSKGICHPPGVVWFAYKRWLETQRRDVPPSAVDVGGDGYDLVLTGWLINQPVQYARRFSGKATVTGLSLPKPPTGELPVNPTGKGCGALTRSAPFGLFCDSPATAWDFAAECAAFTHGHPVGRLPAAAFAWIISEVTHHGRTVAAAAGTALGRLADEAGGEPVGVALRAALDAAAAGPLDRERLAGLGRGTTAEQALAIAVYCAAVPADPRAALLASVNHSGDSDSTGLVCGSLLGAVYGENTLPGDWLTDLEGYQLIGELADDVVRELVDPPTEPDGWGGATPEWFNRYPGG